MSRTVHPPSAAPQVSSLLPKGTVQVSVFLSALPGDVWQKLTRRESVSRWFGDLSASLRSGVEARLDFGDADFFAISEVRGTPPRRLEYRWRFLGTGPVNHIAWDIQAKPGGTLVVVTDSDPMRSDDTVRELQEGWTDFLARLERHSATGEITRYDWRRDFEGSAELPESVEAAAGRLLGPGADLHWLPWKGGDLVEGARLTLAGDPPSEAFVVSNVDRSQERRVTFSLRKNAWLAPTRCEYALEARGPVAFLTVVHTGWDRISTDPSVGAQERRRFGERWVEALRRLRDEGRGRPSP